MLTIRKPIGLIALLVVLGASAIAPTLASAADRVFACSASRSIPRRPASLCVSLTT